MLHSWLNANFKHFSLRRCFSFATLSTAGGTAPLQLLHHAERNLAQFHDDPFTVALTTLGGLAELPAGQKASPFCRCTSLPGKL
jgi:hypothetical protein